MAAVPVAISVAAYHSTVTVRPTEASANEAREFDPHAHHVKDRSGNTIKFKNPYPSFAPPKPRDLFDLITGYYLGSLSWPKPKLEEKLVPVVEPKLLPTRASPPTLRATWLGHACYYVEFPSGLRVLFDPVFEDCCAPVSFLGFKRYTEPPCQIKDLPIVDAVVISHSHYDHLSYPTVQDIHKHHPDAHFFVGLGLEKWFKSQGVDNVTEMDWWQEAELTLTPKPGKEGEDADGKSEPQGPITASFTCLPCQHSSGRSGLDRDKTLWASWAVTSGTAPTPTKSVWFGGDTGYRAVPKVAEGVDDYGPEFAHLPRCPQFAQIGARFGGFDLGLIPIGAYHPRPLFSGMHANPTDAVEIFTDTKCKKAMAIHWGTWVMTPEPVLEPPQLLREALKKKGLPEKGLFDICDIGETREF